MILGCNISSSALYMNQNLQYLDQVARKNTVCQSYHSAAVVSVSQMLMQDLGKSEYQNVNARFGLY